MTFSQREVCICSPKCRRRVFAPESRARSPLVTLRYVIRDIRQRTSDAIRDPTLSAMIDVAERGAFPSKSTREARRERPRLASRGETRRLSQEKPKRVSCVVRRESLPGSTPGAFYLRRARTRASETTRGCARFSAARDDPREGESPGNAAGKTRSALLEKTSTTWRWDCPMR